MSTCHGEKHGKWVMGKPSVTQTGFFSGINYAIGVKLPDQEGTALDALYGGTGASYAFRPALDPDFEKRPELGVGFAKQMAEFPVFDKYGDTTGVYQNPAFAIANLPNGINANNQVNYGSPIHKVLAAAVDSACGDCHFGSAGANNRYGDFRSSGCTACHMQYAQDGRSKSTDPNIIKTEPANPDAIAPGERSHAATHQIRNVRKYQEKQGVFTLGIDDHACAGCHQGSNRTVLQYWGIRLDQNQDVVNNVQYPANPVNFTTTANDTRLYDPVVGNNTFNGRNANQHILTEDYDGDGRDDIPADIHHEKGLYCIDCHGTRDMHNGAEGDESSGALLSLRTQGPKILCTNCHGKVSEYAETKECKTIENETADCAMDEKGNPQRHLTKNAKGEYWLRSKVSGNKHFVTQIKDLVVNSGKINPKTKQPVYSPNASYAMGRADGNPNTGIGPQQTVFKVSQGFSHDDNMDCRSCHVAWANNCIGCHVGSEYNDDPANFTFSNITGERTTTSVQTADFTYITPVPFYLGVGALGKITQVPAGTKSFYRYLDFQGNESAPLTFADRKGIGKQTVAEQQQGQPQQHPGLTFDLTASHSIRGKVTAASEGVKYCVGCHLTTTGINTFGNQYNQFRQNMANGAYQNLDYNLLQNHIGKNPGNQLNSPLWVHMVAGFGSGLFQFNAAGCPTNPLDTFAGRQNCGGVAPATVFQTDPRGVFSTDLFLQPNGETNQSSLHPFVENHDQGAALREGAKYPYMTGPLGLGIAKKLSDPTTGIVLDSWLSSDGTQEGNAFQIFNANK